jgi:hypothetical protein
MLTGESDGPSDRRSRRQRCYQLALTVLHHTGKIRDRDVQGARNILWLTYALLVSQCLANDVSTGV